MSAIVLNVPDDLANRLREHEGEIPRILELGLKELAWTPDETAPYFQEVPEIIKFLARQPAPEEIMSLKASEGFGRRVDELLDKNRSERLGGKEHEEWARYKWAEHLVTLAKAQAFAELHNQRAKA